VQVRVRLAPGLARLTGAPFLHVELEEGATVAELHARIAVLEPELGPALPSALTIVAGEQALPEERLAHRQEVALLLPVAGG
jgi:molybdopterin synthase sulfur carrier subunit